MFILSNLQRYLQHKPYLLCIAAIYNMSTRKIVCYYCINCCLQQNTQLFYQTICLHVTKRQLHPNQNYKVKIKEIKVTKQNFKKVTEKGLFFRDYIPTFQLKNYLTIQFGIRSKLQEEDITVQANWHQWSKKRQRYLMGFELFSKELLH